MSIRKEPVVTKELGERILALRKDLGCSQREFAEKVKAATGAERTLGHTQISEWERGTDAPSTEKLIALATLARAAEERAWFWATAGITEEMVRDTFAEMAANRISSATSGAMVSVPLSKSPSCDPEGKLSFDAKRALLLGAEQFGSAPFVHGFEVQVPLPGVLGIGDIALVDRSPIDPSGLLDSMVAVFFERRHEYESNGLTPAEISRIRRRNAVTPNELKREREQLRVFGLEAGARSEAELRSAHERALEKLKEFMAEPEIIFGWLRLVPIGGVWRSPFEKLQSWVILDSSPTPEGSLRFIPLTDLLTGQHPLEPRIAEHIKRPIHILGPVVGHFKQSSRLPSSPNEIRSTETHPASVPFAELAAPRPDCECGRRCSCICHSNSKYPHREACCGAGTAAHSALCSKGKRSPVSRVTDS